jgi:enamine deaminase RidA (YjgF/YER057c/UK114 family)
MGSFLFVQPRLLAGLVINPNRCKQQARIKSILAILKPLFMKLQNRLLLFIPLLFCINTSFAQTPENKLKALGIILPEVKAPVANYVNAVRVGNLLYLSGKGPSLPDGKYIVGKLGKDITIEQAYEAARLTAIMQIAVLKKELGDLSKVKRVVKVLGMVNCTDGFIDQPKVVNGFSDLMVAVFGDKGKHARSAVGMSSLPFGMVVEVELIVEVE